MEDGSAETVNRSSGIEMEILYEQEIPPERRLWIAVVAAFFHDLKNAKDRNEACKIAAHAGTNELHAICDMAGIDTDLVSDKTREIMDQIWGWKSELVKGLPRRVRKGAPGCFEHGAYIHAV